MVQFYPSFIFIFLCFIPAHYHTQQQRKIKDKIEPQQAQRPPPLPPLPPPPPPRWDRDARYLYIITVETTLTGTSRKRTPNGGPSNFSYKNSTLFTSRKQKPLVNGADTHFEVHMQWETFKSNRNFQMRLRRDSFTVIKFLCFDKYFTYAHSHSLIRRRSYHIPPREHLDPTPYGVCVFRTPVIGHLP